MKKKKLDIIYEDKNIIVINKPSCMLTIGTDKDAEHNLYHEVYEYLHKKNQKVFIVHRLDRDTSGVILFAKSEKIKKDFQYNWDNYAVKREYIAVIEGHLKDKSGIIKEYLAENKQHYVYKTDSKNGRIAITEYEVINETKTNSLLRINIKTGRKNQIRVCFADLGHPIVGDKKYGSKFKNINMLLHANKMIIFNPINKKEMIFEAKIPKQFDIYLK